MFDLTEELQGLVHLYQSRADNQRGAVLAFTSVTSGVGVSTCARAFSRLVAPNSRRGVWLFDLDFYANAQYLTFASPLAAQTYGGIGQPLDPGLNMEPFWRVSPLLVGEGQRQARSSWYMTLHQVGQHRLFVSRFRAEALRSGQSVHVKRASAYWQRLRDAIDLAVIDAPARDRSRSILGIAADVDGVILVAQLGTPPEQLGQLQQEIEARGGTCLGVIFNTRNVMPDAANWLNGRLG